MTQPIEIGRLLRAGTTGFIAGCRVNQLDAPSFGALVRAPLGDAYQIYGLIHDIHIDDDGLVRQLVTADNVSDEVMKDNRERRIVPVEMSVLAVGYEQDGKVYHLLPPRPPLSLDLIYLCDDKDVARFTSTGRFGYLRHILITRIFLLVTCWPRTFSRRPRRTTSMANSGKIQLRTS